MGIEFLEKMSNFYLAWFRSPRLTEFFLDCSSKCSWYGFISIWSGEFYLVRVGLALLDLIITSLALDFYSDNWRIYNRLVSNFSVTDSKFLVAFCSTRLFSKFVSLGRLLPECACIGLCLFCLTGVQTACISVFKSLLILGVLQMLDGKSYNFPSFWPLSSTNTSVISLPLDRRDIRELL